MTESFGMSIMELEFLLWVGDYSYHCFYILWVTWKYALSYFSEITHLILIIHCTVDDLRHHLSPNHMTIQMMI